MQRKTTFKLGLLVGALALAQGAWALGLGKLTTNSPLGQPLQAQIDLMGTNDEFSNLTANIASPQKYQDEDLVYQGALAGTKVTLQHRPDGSAYLSIRSAQPIQEPYIDLLIEVTWPQGHAFREYTVLLDPPKPIDNSKPPVIVPVNDATVSHLKPLAPPPIAPQPKPAPQPQHLASSFNHPVPQAPVHPITPAPQPSAPVAKPAPHVTHPEPVTAINPNTTPTKPDSYRVKAGDTLTDIAESYMPSEITLQQALVALYRANPDAFIHNNMNLLRKGAKLRLPDEEEYKSVSRGEARKVVRVQNREWREYTQTIANSAPTQKEGNEATTKGKISQQRVDVQKPKAGPSVKISSGTEGTSGTPNAGSVNKTNLEDQTQALKNQVADLKEKNAQLEDINKKSKTLNIVEQQQQQQQQSQKGISVPSQGLSDLGKPPVAKPASPVNNMPTNQPPETTTQQQTTPAPVATPPVPPVATPAPAVNPQPTPKPQPMPIIKPLTQPSVLDVITDNLLYIGIGIIIILLVIAFFVWRRRRSYEEGDSMFTDVTGTTGTSMTTSSTSLASRSSVMSEARPAREHVANPTSQNSNSILSEFSQGVDNLVTGEVDPLAEADVYLAYGRAQQAEEILQEALKKSPDRQDVILKLLEVLADEKKTNEFEVAANHLFQLTGGKGDNWQRCKALGKKLMPNNPRFAEAPQTVQPSVMPTEMSEPLSALSTESVVVNGRQTPAQGFAPMETPSVAQSIASAASRNLETRARAAQHQQASSAGESTRTGLDSPSMLSQMSELSLEPEKTQEDDLGVDLDLEELSRFRNIGNHEEQVNNDAAHSESQQQESFTENPSQFSAPLSEFDLDEPKSEAEASEAEAATAGSFSPMAAETEGPWNDVATKLDLARAYQATGDVEACREILQEVLKEGDDQQKAEAQKILASL